MSDTHTTYAIGAGTQRGPGRLWIARRSQHAYIIERPSVDSIVSFLTAAIFVEDTRATCALDSLPVRFRKCKSLCVFIN